MSIHNSSGKQYAPYLFFQMYIHTLLNYINIAVGSTNFQNKTATLELLSYISCSASKGSSSLDRGNTRIPTCAVNRVNTAQYSCPWRITAFNQTIIVNDTSCQSRLYSCRWTRSTAGVCMYGSVYDWDDSTGRTNGITPAVLKIPVIYIYVKAVNIIH